MQEHSVNFLKHNTHYTSAQELSFTKDLCKISEVISDSYMTADICKNFDLGIATEVKKALLIKIHSIIIHIYYRVLGCYFLDFWRILDIWSLYWRAPQGIHPF